jgi:hypothetical protein
MSVDPPGVLYVITVLLVGFVIVGLPRIIAAVQRHRARLHGTRPFSEEVPALPKGFRYRLAVDDLNGVLVAYLERETLRTGADEAGPVYVRHRGTLLRAVVPDDATDKGWEFVDYVTVATDGESVKPERVVDAFHTLALYAQRRSNIDEWVGVYQPGDPL